MSPPDDENGASGPPSPSDAVHDHSTIRQAARRRGSDRSVLAVAGPIVDGVQNVWLPPDERRAADAWAIESCPFCTGAHLHRGKPGVRRAPCRGGRYWVGPWATT